jgi:flagellar biosynthesis chaperone FliJ
MLDLNFILGILEDYCDLQASGIVESANRYGVSDVRQQIEFIENLDTESAEVIAGADELKLARTVLSHRSVIKRLEHEKEALEKRVGELENGVLAKRVAELSRQLNGMDKLLDSLQDQRDAQAAIVEKLKADITTALRGTKIDHVVRDGDGLVPFGKTETAISVLTAALCNLNDEDAKKYLAERDAVVGRQAFIAGIMVETGYTVDAVETLSGHFADEYVHKEQA